MAGFTRRAALAFWSTIPMMLTVMLMAAYLVPKHITSLAGIVPLMHMIAIFYWAMADIRNMPYWFVFLAGVLIDVLTGLPLGISSLLYVIFVMFLRMQRKFVHKEGFFANWAFFGALLMVICGIQWLLITSLGDTNHSLFPLFIQWLITVCCYPIFSRMFDGVHAVIASRKFSLLHSK